MITKREIAVIEIMNAGRADVEQECSKIGDGKVFLSCNIFSIHNGTQ